MQPNFIDRMFRFTIQNRTNIIFIYKVISVSLLGVFFWAWFDPGLYVWGILAGKIALIVYAFTVIPGIGRRFKLRHKLLSILMMFRRYNGILMFILISLHFWIVRGLFYIHNGIAQWPPVFQLYGIVALFLTFFMFVTSNDLSIKLLKKGWHWLHKLTYVVIWLIAFHVSLQGIDIWAVFIDTVLLIQTASLIFRYFNPPQAAKVVVPQQTPPADSHGGV